MNDILSDAILQYDLSSTKEKMERSSGRCWIAMPTLGSVATQTGTGLSSHRRARISLIGPE